MSNKPQRQMRSLSDLPKPILILEGIGIALLIVVLLAMNSYLELPEPLMQKGALIAIVMVGIGCLIPATINIVWRAIHGLSFLGIDNEKTARPGRKQKPSDNDKKDEKGE
ncbi:YbjC family protein [Providencia manganoxydans]|uniref:YbjC family protein n=1 Tax=Providencia manganoxydans TaxID=2923283 RepID=A0ABX7AD70_9GAMM|nr:YbjC family protein [Providencia manganoxydans]MDX4946563.1 YbjC family protein [Providencia manganoxydans]QQO61453.1 YbjC family protein [Providencia manganoxydans]